MGKKIFLFLAFLLTSCSYQYIDIPTIDEYDYSLISDYKIKWSDIFSKNDENYFLYFYSESCFYCEELKQDILYYFDNEKPIMYFVEDDEDFVIGNDANKLIGVSDLKSFYILGTPTLVKIENKKVTFSLVGVNKIKEYII